MTFTLDFLYVNCILFKAINLAGGAFFILPPVYIKKYKTMKKKVNKKKIYNFKNTENNLTILAELVKSEEELKELIKQLDLRILPSENKDYVCETICYDTDENIRLIEEKWRFMIAAYKAAKKQPYMFHKILIEGWNVDNIDASLAEIRERLGCKVYKLYSNGFENYILEEDDLTISPITFQRVGWLVLSHKLYKLKTKEV